MSETIKSTVTDAVIRAITDQPDDQLRDYTRAYARWALESEGEMRDVQLGRLKFTVIATSHPIQTDDPIGQLWVSFTRHDVEMADWLTIAQTLAKEAGDA
ncbi:hypothetical protein [Nonomuraea sp. NPDC049141]|uniref:hypothetical protein n=1 Tax=Nonomuraea sp. NPDC049141 TaxID=3155500 RepID=UPI0033D5AFAC